MEKTTAINTLEVIRKSVVENMREMGKQRWAKELSKSIRTGETVLDKHYLDIICAIDAIEALALEHEEQGRENSSVNLAA
ncbi:hypothetical protein QNI16_23545 [Cytophagaceae bacterium YF14B1]|uniref:Uncharacterized protein n=1 Tax=Xanthocytophaga flava TaxID=3048013 RepID=A0AAE3QU99_9BACT|nr:hypothetical protein [Xanthocytophaga flavus]MDJ1483493.1 hypothetical protein [Xanthocytophaga flavus]